MASRGEWGQRVFGLDIRVLARVMAFAGRVEGVRVWRVLTRVMVSACVFGARVPLARACWVGCLAVCLRDGCVVRVGLGSELIGLTAAGQRFAEPMFQRLWFVSLRVGPCWLLVACVSARVVFAGLAACLGVFVLSSSRVFISPCRVGRLRVRMFVSCRVRP